MSDPASLGALTAFACGGRPLEGHAQPRTPLYERFPRSGEFDEASACEQVGFCGDG